MKAMTALVGIGGIILSLLVAIMAAEGGVQFAILAAVLFGFGWLFVLASQFLER